MSTHGCSFQIVWRNHDNTERKWAAKCACGDVWTGPEYEVVEDGWREHVHSLTGKAPQPAGMNKTDRWQP